MESSVDENDGQERKNIKSRIAAFETISSTPALTGPAGKGPASPATEARSTPTLPHAGSGRKDDDGEVTPQLLVKLKPTSSSTPFRSTSASGAARSPSASASTSSPASNNKALRGVALPGLSSSSSNPSRPSTKDSTEGAGSDKRNTPSASVTSLAARIPLASSPAPSLSRSRSPSPSRTVLPASPPAPRDLPPRPGRSLSTSSSTVKTSPPPIPLATKPILNQASGYSTSPVRRRTSSSGGGPLEAPGVNANVNVHPPSPSVSTSNNPLRKPVLPPRKVGSNASVSSLELSTASLPPRPAGHAAAVQSSNLSASRPGTPLSASSTASGSGSSMGSYPKPHAKAGTTPSSAGSTGPNMATNTSGATSQVAPPVLPPRPGAGKIPSAQSSSAGNNALAPPQRKSTLTPLDAPTISSASPPLRTSSPAATLSARSPSGPDSRTGNLAVRPGNAAALASSPINTSSWPGNKPPVASGGPVLAVPKRYLDLWDRIVAELQAPSLPVVIDDGPAGRRTGNSKEDYRVPGAVVREIWKRSRLDDAFLRKTWIQCDMAKKGSLDKQGFVKGLGLIDEELASKARNKRNGRNGALR